MRKILVGFFIVSLAVFLVACGKGSDKTDESVQAPDLTVEISEEEKINEDKVVASVNGKEVKGSTYNIVYSQLKAFASQMGEEVDIEEVQESTMESLIDREIVIQEAKEKGIEVTDKIVNTEFDKIKSENEAGLNKILQQFNLTEEGFKEQLMFELVMNEYIEKVINVKVTNEEVEKYYNELKEDSKDKDMPELKDIQAQLRAQVEQEKIQEALQENVKKLKEKAKIEELI